MADSAVSALDEILGYQTKASGCSVPKIIEGLTANEQIAVQEALNDAAVQATSIWKFLQARGVSISTTTVQRHRRGACGCPRG